MAVDIKDSVISVKLLKTCVKKLGLVLLFLKGIDISCCSLKKVFCAAHMILFFKLTQKMVGL